MVIPRLISWARLTIPPFCNKFDLSDQVLKSQSLNFINGSLYYFYGACTEAIHALNLSKDFEDFKSVYKN